MTDSRAPRIALVNLGCAKNTIDSEAVLGRLLEEGWDLAVEPADADLIVVNTCGFIQSARDESLAVLREMIALKDEEGFPRVIALGCLSQRLGKELTEAVPELDAVLGLGAHEQLTELCEQVLARSAAGSPAKLWNLAKNTCRAQTRESGMVEGVRLLLTPPSYAYLRIAEGCDNRCSYCAIPRIRGPLRSREEDLVLDEARQLADSGVRELVLVAQDTAAWGMDATGSSQLAPLLERLLAEVDVPRIRVLYAHPAHLDDATIDLLSSEIRLCGYLDLPIQHIHDPILDSMHRRYDRARIERILDRLRKNRPDFVVRTSVITGLPGETEDAYRELLAVVEAGWFQHLGAFAYSPEAGTKAAHWEAPATDVAVARRDEILAAQQEVAFTWQESRVGQEVDVLLDRAEGEEWVGRSASEAPEVDPVVRIAGKEFHAGAMIRACLLRRLGYDLVAKPQPM